MGIISIMYIQTIKISSKGQVVLPKKIRSALGSNIISIKLDDNNQITLSSVPSLAGALSSYQKESNLSFKEIRNKSWKESINTKKENKEK